MIPEEAVPTKTAWMYCFGRFPEDSIRLSLIKPSAKPEYDCGDY